MRGALGGPGLRGAERQREVLATGAGRADSWAGRPISAPLEHSQLIPQNSPQSTGLRPGPKSTLHLTCLPLALTLTVRWSWLSSSARAAPGKGLWKMIMLSMTPCSTSSVQVGVARKAHSDPLGAPEFPPLERPARVQASWLQISAFYPAEKKVRSDERASFLRSALRPPWRPAAPRWRRVCSQAWRPALWR